MKTIFIKKANVHVDLDESKVEWYMAEAAWRGFKEVLQDSVAGAKSADEASGMLNKCVAKLLNGTYSSHERASDPLGKIAKAIAIKWYNVACHKAGSDPTKDGLKQYIIDNGPAIRAAADSVAAIHAEAPDA